jgi:polyisoprenoid-binding protein YceI
MSRLTKIIIGTIVALVVLAVAAVALFILPFEDAPEAVDLEATVARIEAGEAAESGEDHDHDDHEGRDHGTEIMESATDAVGNVTTAPPRSMDDAAAEMEPDATTTDETSDASAGLAGVWTVEVADDPGDLQGEAAVSFAGFRVDEVLDNIGDFTAVGRTAKVDGSIELSDTSLVAATVEVQMGTLRTDNSFRDGRAHQALNTSEFPLATFTLTEPVELPAGMAGGEAFSGSAVGDLTIKGITNQVTFNLQAQLVGDRIVAVGSSDVVFSDYGVTAPTAPIVVSVEDHGIMEFQLILTR